MSHEKDGIESGLQLRAPNGRESTLSSSSSSSTLSAASSANASADGAKNTIFVSNLPLTASEDMLRSLFGAYGALVRCKLVNPSASAASPSAAGAPTTPYAFIEFAAEDQALKAIAARNGSSVADKTIKVAFADASQRLSPSNAVNLMTLPAGANAININSSGTLTASNGASSTASASSSVSASPASSQPNSGRDLSAPVNTASVVLNAAAATTASSDGSLAAPRGQSGAAVPGTTNVAHAISNGAGGANSQYSPLYAPGTNPDEVAASNGNGANAAAGASTAASVAHHVVSGAAGSGPISMPLLGLSNIVQTGTAPTASGANTPNGSQGPDSGSGRRTNSGRERPRTNVYIAGLPGNFSKPDLEALFAPFGRIIGCRVLAGADGATSSRGFGFVRFDTNEAAQAAITTLHGAVPNKCQEALTVKFAREPNDPNHPSQRQAGTNAVGGPTLVGAGAGAGGLVGVSGLFGAPPLHPPTQQALGVGVSVGTSPYAPFQANSAAAGLPPRAPLYNNPYAPKAISSAAGSGSSAYQTSYIQSAAALQQQQQQQLALQLQQQQQQQQQSAFASYGYVPGGYDAQAQAHAAQVAQLTSSTPSPTLQSVSVPINLSAGMDPLSVDQSQHHPQQQQHHHQQQPQQQQHQPQLPSHAPQQQQSSHAPNQMIPSGQPLQLGAGIVPLRPNTNLYVSGLPPHFTKVELDSVFSQFGRIIGSRVLTNGQGQSRGIGFVRFDTQQNALRAIQSLHGTTPVGSAEQISVKFARDSGNNNSKLKAQLAAAAAAQHSGGQPSISGGSGGQHHHQQQQHHHQPQQQQQQYMHQMQPPQQQQQQQQQQQGGGGFSAYAPMQQLAMQQPQQQQQQQPSAYGSYGVSPYGNYQPFPSAVQQATAQPSNEQQQTGEAQAAAGPNAGAAQGLSPRYASISPRTGVATGATPSKPPLHAGGAHSHAAALHTAPQSGAYGGQQQHTPTYGAHQQQHLHSGSSPVSNSPAQLSPVQMPMATPSSQPPTIGGYSNAQAMYFQQQQQAAQAQQAQAAPVQYYQPQQQYGMQQQQHQQQQHEQQY